ncbi:MAG: hypothetical protein H0T41_00760 [Rhodobacteraceae bacterium]|nr:hypothetical protein [Paracoccaceae bacterium]
MNNSVGSVIDVEDDAGLDSLALPFADDFVLTDPGPDTSSEVDRYVMALDWAPVDALAPTSDATRADPSLSRLISGTRFADDIRGTSRDDEIFARPGADLVRARDGDDLVDGGNGRDLLYGGDGRDDIFGGRGRDTIYGGRGRDNFWFDEEDSYDRIRDFRAGDTLVVDGEFGDFAGARRRDIDIEGGRRYDEIYVFDDLVARVYGDLVISDDILLLT